MSKTLELTKTHQENQSSDLISWCVEDIISKLENIKSYSEKTDKEKTNFKSVIYSDFLKGISNNLVKDIVEMSDGSDNYQALNALIDTEDPKEFFSNLSVFIAMKPELTDNFVDYTVAIYLGLCTKFYILADSKILSLTKTLS